MTLPISIVIITLNEVERIANLLDDLCQQTYQNFEVILVDSNSEDETCTVAQTYAKKLPTLTIHVMHQRGVCLGRNTGANLAHYERLLFLDADVRLSPTFLADSAEHLEIKNLNVAGVYLSAKGLSKHFVFGYKLFNAGIYATQFVFPTAVGACVFSTKTIHNKIDGFDSSITLCEDCDYVNRASKITKFRMLPVSFSFDPRRLQQDGYLQTGWKYLYANLHRLFLGEIRNQKINYEFGHYKETPPATFTKSKDPHQKNTPSSSSTGFQDTSPLSSSNQVSNVNTNDIKHKQPIQQHSKAS